MIGLASSAARRQSGQGDVQVAVLPAPIRGMDGRSNLAVDNADNCVFSTNLMPSEYGMRTRFGWREHAVNLEVTPGVGLGVRTIIPFSGATSSGAADKLFAATNEGIWEVTTFGAAPVLKQPFTDTGAEAGFCTYIHNANAAGAISLLVADRANGLFVYTPATDTWAQASGITGINVLLVTIVMRHKERIWLVERESSDAFYLPLGSASGAATAFHMGGKFKHGGAIAGLFNWSVDGGEGVDDYLVFISRAGDVMPYLGADPSDASTWTNKGAFFIGEVPPKHRFAGQYGGDLFLLSRSGLIAMTDLLRGIDIQSIAATSLAFRIARFLRTDMQLSGSRDGWQVLFDGTEGVLTVATPRRADGTYRQYVLNLTTDGWGFWRGVPMLCFDTWKTFVYFGTEDGRVCVMDAQTDGGTLDGDVGEPIEFVVLFNYHHFDLPGKFKRGVLARPNWLSQAPPTFTTRFLYDFEVDFDLIFSPLPAVLSDGWDFGLWDISHWGSVRLNTFSKLFGTSGQGRTLAPLIMGAATTRAMLLSVDVHWRPGHGL